MKFDIVAKDTCPRRYENYAVVEEMLDGWYFRDNLLWCNYCGSLQPNMLLSLMLSGCELGPTDKNYKVYIKNVDGGYIGKFYFQHFTLEDRMRFIEIYNTKPRNFTIGYPGHFYVLPFFIKLEVNDDDRG